MSISPIGYLLIPLGILLFLSRRRNLFWATVISMMFWNSSVLYIHAITFYLRSPMFFMTLLIIKKTLDSFISGRLGISKNRANFFLACFLVLVGFSLVIPFLINGKVDTYPIGTNQAFNPIPPKKPLYFGLINITQFLYLVFAVLSFFTLSEEMFSKKRIEKVLDISVLLGVVVAISGFVYQILTLCNCSHTVLNFYSFLGAPYLNLEGKLYFGKIPRMYSIMGEPSLTTLFLLFTLGLAAPSPNFKKYAFVPKRPSIISLIIIALGLLLTTSTTAYLGIIIFVTSFSFVLSLKYKPATCFRIISNICILGIALVIVTFVVFRIFFDYSMYNFFMDTQIAKVMLKHGSGAIRWHYIVENLRIFVQYPILGVGIGGCRSTATLPALLSNTGVLGTIPFLLFNWYVFKKTLSQYLNSKQENAVFLGSLLVAFLTIFILRTFACSIASLYFLEYWLLLAMMSKVSLFNHKNAYEYCS